MAGNPATWFEIAVNDMERARGFYESVFQLQLERLPVPEMEYWSFPMDEKQYGAGGALMRMPGMDPGGGGTLVYFSCDDCAVEEARVAPSGGRVVRPKQSIGEFGFISLVADTEGNTIGLHSMR